MTHQYFENLDLINSRLKYPDMSALSANKIFLSIASQFVKMCFFQTHLAYIRFLPTPQI